jgi:hypothetical protein
MFLLDRLLVGGLKFVLEKVASVADQQLNDSDRIREELLALQMRQELGEITEAEFRSAEADLLERLRGIREREGGPALTAGLNVTGIEATTAFDEEAGPR